MCAFPDCPWSALGPHLQPLSPTSLLSLCTGPFGVSGRLLARESISTARCDELQYSSWHWARQPLPRTWPERPQKARMMSRPRSWRECQALPVGVASTVLLTDAASRSSSTACFASGAAVRSAAFSEVFTGTKRVEAVVTWLQAIGEPQPGRLLG